MQSQKPQDKGVVLPASREVKTEMEVERERFLM